MQLLFISYARADVDTARRIYDALLGRPDIQPWLDLTRLELVEYDPAIKREIDRAAYVLVLISKASLVSAGYVATEWAYARAGGKRRIPVLLDASCERRPQLPDLLKDVKDINWLRVYESFEESMQKLLREVYRDIAGETFRETFSSLGTDNDDEVWRQEGWELEDSDAGNQKSQSMSAEVAPDFFSQTQTRTLAIPVTLGRWSRIAYARKVLLHRANMGAAARFAVTLSDGSHVVVIEEIELAGDGGLDYSDGDWQLVERDLDLKQFPGKDVMLNFVLSAYDLIAVPLTKGKAQIDNIWID